MTISKSTSNVCQLGVVFFFNFFSYFTLSSLTQTIIESIGVSKGISEYAGYYCSFITYSVFTIGHFVATPIVEIITPKWSIVVGLFGYAMFEVAFILLNETFLYISAAFSGFSGSLLWTGQFDYLAQNSRPHTLDRNSSNLWGISQLSLVFGGVYLLFIYQFQSTEGFDIQLVHFVVSSFLVATLISSFIGVLLPQPVFKAEKYDISYFHHLKEIAKIQFDPTLLHLFFTFCYTGMELSFYSIIFPTMVSFTKEMGNNRALNAISSICIGLGNVAGSMIISFLGYRIRDFGRKRMLSIASGLHFLCYFLIFLFFPTQSPLKPTNDVSYFAPSGIAVVICGLLLGLGDTIFNMQCYTILSDVYEHDKRIEAFAVYRFYQSAASCLTLFYAPHANLNVHLTLLVIFNILSAITFSRLRNFEKMVDPASRCLPEELSVTFTS